MGKKRGEDRREERVWEKICKLTNRNFIKKKKKTHVKYWSIHTRHLYHPEPVAHPIDHVSHGGSRPCAQHAERTMPNDDGVTCAAKINMPLYLFRYLTRKCQV